MLPLAFKRNFRFSTQSKLKKKVTEISCKIVNTVSTVLETILFKKRIVVNDSGTKKVPRYNTGVLLYRGTAHLWLGSSLRRSCTCLEARALLYRLSKNFFSSELQTN